MIEEIMKLLNELDSIARAAFWKVKIYGDGSGSIIDSSNEVKDDFDSLKECKRKLQVLLGEDE